MANVQLDVERHGGELTPSEPIQTPQTGGTFELDANVVNGRL